MGRQVDVDVDAGIPRLQRKLMFLSSFNNVLVCDRP